MDGTGGAKPERVDGVELPIALVVGIARLGERGLRGWWRSYGLSEAGRYSLERTFPRTARWTAVQLDVLSAQRRHDDALQRPTALHLFSDHLPFHRLATSWLAEGKTSGGSELLDRLQAWDLPTAITDLRAWSSSDRPEGEVLGVGLRLGRLDPSELSGDVPAARTAQRLAAAYLDQGHDVRLPYFDRGH